jgi:hypothetical protein
MNEADSLARASELLLAPALCPRKAVQSIP